MTLKSRWITALRSRSYRQGRNRLKQARNGRTTYCCLGVLANLIDPKEWSPTGSGTWRGGSPSSLPGTCLPHSVQDALISLNDFDKAGFAKIATYIEEHVPSKVIKAGRS